MPELPEVETVVRALRPLVIGRKILDVRQSRKKLRLPWRKRWNDGVRGQTIRQVHRRGKWIFCNLDSGYLVIHLGMTGRLHVVRSEQPWESHTHVSFVIDRQEELRFRDPRRFGFVNYWTEGAWSEFQQSGKLGPEPFEVKAAELYTKLTKTERVLKAILLDQKIIAGVGNIYADEALFVAKLHPQKRGSEVTPKEAERLLDALVKVMTRAIEKHGSTFLSFYYGDGVSGDYQNEFLAYQRTGLPCSRCATIIRQISLAGRSTHFCPRCQPGPRRKR